MKPSELAEALEFSIKNNFNVLIKGKPGIGKTDIVNGVAEKTEAKLIVSHPVVSDPTDYKGLPFPGQDGKAHFLPFGELNELIEATEKTIYFLDDLGQASNSVQAAVMQLLLSRRINGFKVSDQVCFVAATNRREDKAAVGGLLEPVKSRFASIVELEVNTNDWVKWAIDNDMPTELIAFIRFRPELLEKFEPTKDIVNTPCPRTVTAVGRMQNAGLPKTIEYEMIKGAVGEGFAAEYVGFLKIYRELPSIDQIILSPDSVEVPTQAATLYALAGALGARLNDQTAKSICTYMDRLPPEISVVCMKDVFQRNKKLAENREIIKWFTKNQEIIL